MRTGGDNGAWWCLVCKRQHGMRMHSIVWCASGYMGVSGVQVAIWECLVCKRLLRGVSGVQAATSYCIMCKRLHDGVWCASSCMMAFSMQAAMWWCASVYVLVCKQLCGGVQAAMWWVAHCIIVTPQSPGIGFGDRGLGLVCNVRKYILCCLS